MTHQTSAETRTLVLGGKKAPVTIRGSGPLVVFDYPFGTTAWGPLDQVSKSFTTAVPEWHQGEGDPLSRNSEDWFAELVSELGFRKAALCTWSMGSPAAIRYAAKNPDTLSALLLVDPAGLGSKIPKTVPLSQLHHVPALAYTLITKKPTRGYVKLLWNLWISNPRVNKRPLVDAMLDLWTRPDSFGMRNEAIDEVMKNPLFDELKQIDVPTFIMTGRISKVLGPVLAENAVGLLGHGKFVVFEESNHGPQLEEPEKFERVVIDFLSEVQPASEK